MQTRFGIVGAVGSAVVALGLTAAVPASAGCGDSNDHTTIQLILTASGNGEIDQCGCKKNPKGGLAWRASFIESMREQCPNTLVMDGGNWSSNDALTAELTNGFVHRMMSRMGYDAVSLGTREIAAGAADATGRLLHEDASVYAPLGSDDVMPMVLASNLTTAAGDLVGATYLVRDFDDTRVGVFTLMGDDVLKSSTATLNGVPVVAEDATVAAARHVAELGARDCDVIVLIAHLEPDAIESLVAEVPGIDVVLMSHRGGLRQTHAQIGDTILVRPGTRGQYVAWLALDVDATGAITTFDGRTEPLLIDEIQRDHETYVLVSELQEAISAMKEQAVLSPETAERSAASHVATTSGTY